MAARKLKVSTTGYKENSKDKNLKELYVPSPNLTMTNVNRRVKAIPVYENGSYGVPITMMPGVPNYSFPGAVGVIEKKLRKAQLVGEVPPEYETVNVTDPNDPAYQEYLYLQNLYNWSNIQDFDRRNQLSNSSYYGIKNRNSTGVFPASRYSEDYDQYNKPTYNDDTNDGLFNSNMPGSQNYNSDETGYYGSKANRYTFNTKAELDNFIATNARLNPSISRRFNDNQEMQQLIDKYAPIGYDAMVDWNYPQIGYDYRYNGPPNKQIFIRPITPVLEDEIDREALRKIYPGYSDEEIDEVVATNRLTPSYVTNTYGDDGKNQDISFDNTNEDPNYVHPNVVKQQPYDVYDDNGDIVGKTNASPYDWSPRAGVTGYLPESISEYNQTQRANYLPRFGTPESYLGKKYVYTEPEKVQESNENYTLHYSGNPGVAYVHYKKDNGDGTFTEKNLGATQVKDWLDDEQQKQFHSPSGGTARVNYNPNAKMYTDVKDAIDQVEDFREQEKRLQKRRKNEASQSLKFQKGGDISIPDLRKVTINALPKAQIEGEFSNPDFKPSWDWTQTAAENAELNRRAQLAGHNSVDDYRASGWAWQPKQYQTPSVQDQVFTGRHSVAKEDVPLPTMTKSKIPGLSKSTHPDVQMLQQKAADVAEWVDTEYKEESPEEREQRSKESFIKYMTTPGKEDLEKVNPETGYAKAAYTGRGAGSELGGMSLWNPADVANSGINDADVNEYLNALYTKQQQAERVAQITLDLGFSKDEKEKERLSAELKDKKYILAQSDKVLNNTAFNKKLWDYQTGRQEAENKANMIGTATSTFGPLDAAVSLPALAATFAMPILGTSLTLGSAVNPFFYAAGINGFLNPNSDFSQAAEAWSKGTGKGEDVLWEAAFNSLNFLGAKSVPTDIKNFGKAYKEIATGNSLLADLGLRAWRSPAVGLSQEASAKMFNSLLNSGKMTPVERNIVLEYQHNSAPFTGRFGNHTIDVAKRDALNNIINKYQLQFPQNSNAIATRRFNFERDNLGANIENGRINFGDRPTSFSAGVGSEGYQGAPDRLVIPSRYLPKMKNNFMANEYSIIPKEHLELIGQPSLTSREKLIEFGSGIGTRNKAVSAERELIGKGLDFKQIGKVKNDIGGFDVIVKPRNVKAGTSTTKNATGQPKWVKPSATQLKQEFRVEHELKGHKYFASEAEFQRAVDEAKIEEITPELDQAIQNKSRHGSREAMIESNKNYKSWPKYRNENTIDGIYEGMQSGAKMDMPIVLEFKDGTRRMFSGNTRMDVAFQTGKNPEALIVKVPEASAAGGAGETLSAAGETSNIPENLTKQGIKSTHRELANLTDKLRRDRVKFWHTPEGTARLKAVIENTPELKAAGITVGDYVRGIESMTVENRTAVNNLERGRSIVQEQKAAVKQLEEMQFLEQQTGMAHPDQGTISKLEEKIAALDDELRTEMNDFYSLNVNSTHQYNAFMMRGEPKVKAEPGIVNLNKVGVNKDTRFTTGVGAMYNLDEAERIINHEFGHLIQRGVQTNLDKELQGLDLLKKESSDLFSSANKKSSYFKDALDYFKNGSKGREKLPFLEEVRSDMLQKGIIKDFGDEITEGMIRQHHANYMLEGRSHKGALRIYDIMKNNPKNFSILKSVINKMPVAIIGAGVGSQIMGGDEEGQVLPQKKRGGRIKHVDFIASRNNRIANSLPKAQTMGEVPYEIAEEPYRDPKISRDSYDREYYDPMTETIHMKPSYPNVIHEVMVKDHESEHHNQKLKGRMSSTEYWPGPLKEPVIGASADMIYPYYNRATQDVYNLMGAAPQSTLFGIPEDVAVMGFQDKTYDTPGTAEYEAEHVSREPRTLYMGDPVVENAIDKTLGRQRQDPEMMFKDKYNTELTKEETNDFNKWVAKESKQQGRDIMMDKGAYDIQGFWKSGDWKKRDADNHGTDTWKKPNHPTFSNESKYHGADGWYGGNWEEDAGYQPSKQTFNTYGPDYYNWMFGNEPNRPEHLDMSRYISGENYGFPITYEQGGNVRRVKIKSLPKNWKNQ